MAVEIDSEEILLARRLKNSLLEAIVRSTRDGIVVVDASGDDLRVLFANPAFEAMTGYSTEELQEHGLGTLQGDGRDQGPVKEMAESIRRGESCEVLVQNYRKDGTKFWNQLRLVPVEEKGQLAWWIGIARDVGEIRKLEDRLKSRREQLKEARSLAPDDRLTGLRSRIFFDELLKREWSVCKREERSITLFLFDMDFFVSYNETFGRKAGDSCLRLAGQAVRAAFRRGSDVVARYEGQRFACMGSGMEQGPALEFAERICARVRELSLPHPHSPGGRFVTVGCGVVTRVPGGGDTLEGLIEDCVAALARAKMAGGNQASE